MQLFWTILWLTLVSSALESCGGLQQQANSETCGPTSATVSAVVDGDTVVLQNGTRVRYLLVDTPELDHHGHHAACFAVEATQLNAQLVAKREIVLEYDAQCIDKYGRTLAYVYVDERMVNRMLVERGYARVEVIPPNQRYADAFFRLEEVARAHRAGLWGRCENGR